MKSSFSGKQGNCLDVMGYKDGNRILIRETKPITENDRAVVTTKENFRVFILGVKAGEFDHLVED